MDKTVLRNFAVESRKDLMEKIDRKIKLFYIDEEFEKENRGDVIVLSNDKHTLTLTKEEDSNRDKLIKRIVELGYEQVVEEAAYTWFNRFIAIRYMEINDYLPLTADNQSLSIRVLSSNDNTSNPEILKFTNLTRSDLDIGFDKNKYNEYPKEEDRFKYVLLLICRKLGSVIPQVFDGVTDYIDLLIPDNLLGESGFVGKLIKELDEGYFKKVEVIGWLYQYYNQTEKDRVINAKKAYLKNEIPYATQLFTPDWIVKYMVENSLGKYWLEHGGDKSLSNNWEFYVNSELTSKKKILPEEIKFIDPCCGSGHIIVYAFEILYQIYVSEGYSKNTIPELILKNNIFALDIDDRAGQLSILSILLKAREYDKNIFNKNIVKDLNVCSMSETKSMDINYKEMLNDEKVKDQYLYLKDKYENAKEIGSLIKEGNKDCSELKKYIMTHNDIFIALMRNELDNVLKQEEILSQKYDVVVTNPPYMNDKYMSNLMKEYAIKNYKSVKSDLFSMFFIKMFNLGNDDSYIGTIAPFVWMFIKTYEPLREIIVNTKTIDSLVQLEYNAFEAACVPVGIYTFKNHFDDKYEGTYIKLSDFTGADNQPIKTLEALNNDNCDYKYKINSHKFVELPSKLIAYWLPERMFEVFSSAKPLSEYAEPKQGMATTDNNQFLRKWYEVEINRIKFDAKDTEEAKESGFKWFPYNKGGEYRKWYGNNEYIVNYENDGKEIKENVLRKYPYLNSPEFVVKNSQSYFKKGITWSYISSTNFGVRYSNPGFIFDVSGSCIFPKEEYFDYIMGLLCTKLSKQFLDIINPTMNIQAGSVGSIPTIIDMSNIDEIKNLVEENIELSKSDWDSRETSWDFKGFDLCNSIEEMVNNIINSEKQKLDKLLKNEERLNQIYLKIYGLDQIIDYRLSPDDITLEVKQPITIVKEFINYIVGCIFGRYDSYKKGFICAGKDYNSNNYSHYKPDNDNIIPISDSANIFYKDDLVKCFITYIENVYGKDNLFKNLDYLAEIIGKRGTETSEDTLRRYFVNDFYNNHVQIYQKRPIFWLFDSGKKNGFKCLIYYHRYNEQTVSKIRVDYLHKTISVYENNLSEIDYKLNNEDLNVADKRELQNSKSEYIAKLKECNEYEERVGNVANKMIKLDLDDGILTNYGKLVDDNGKSILAKIK